MATTETQLDRKSAPAEIQADLIGKLSVWWTRSRVVWASMGRGQKNGFLVAAVLLAMLLGGVLWYGVRTDWRTLYAGMDPDDARQTGITLTQAQIPFEVASNGTSILVPSTSLDKARLVTAAKGGVKSGRLGFELFDKPNWVGSEFDERVNYQRALEGELEHTVATLSDVESARVHLVLPHDSLFREEERPAKASVVLKLRHRSLADGEADAIRNLVASAVDDLTPEKVMLVDAAGNLPLGPKTPDALRLSAEQALEDKLISTLEPVTGIGNVRAAVTLDYDSDSTDETQETYDPDKTATLSMQRTEQTTGAQPVAAGVPGTASNAPNTQKLPVYPRQTSPPETAKSESGTYGVSKTVRHVTAGPGKLRRMTAAIVVNDRLVRPASRGVASEWRVRSPEELRNLTVLAQAAVGFDPSRGDMLTVEDLAFDENRSQQPMSVAAQALSKAENSPIFVKYVGLFLTVLIVLAFGVRPALRTVTQKPAQLPVKSTGGDLAAHTTERPALNLQEATERDPERLRAQEIIEQVSDHLKREPAQSSRLLQSWIHSE